MYENYIYDLNVLEDKFEETSLGSHVSLIARKVTMGESFEEILNVIVEMLNVINDNSELTYEDDYENGWNSAMEQIADSIEYK